MRICSALWWILLFSLALPAASQTYTPIAVTGYNHDVFAESFPDAVAATDTVLDFTSHIMYTQNFATASGLPAGVPNSGSISDAANIHQYQLAAFNAPNALTAMRNTSRLFTLVTPASYSKLSLLCFSTENASTINVSVRFTDGTTTAYITNYTLADWFNSTTNVVVSGFGRCQRFSSGPYGQDGYPTNPRFYYLDFNLNCTDQQKTVQDVILSNVTSTGINAPFPNAVFLALSGAAYSQTITSSTTSATCSSANGSATLNVTGTSGPYSISWNTTPTQTGVTASGLNGGNYIATITDANSCNTTYNVTVPSQASTVTELAAANPSTICSGASVQLTVTPTGGTLNSFNWTPGNLSGTSVSVSPTTTTVYNVSGQDQYGCAYTQDVTVTVNNAPPPPVVNNTQVCQGGQVNLSVQSPQAGASYNWYSSSSGGSAITSGTNYQTPNLSSTTTYYVEAVSSAGCINLTRTGVTVTVNNPPSAPSVNAVSICPGTQADLTIQTPQAGETYNWYNASSGGTSVFTGTAFQTPVLSSNTNYFIDAVSSFGCVSTTRGSVTVTMLQPLPKPVVTITTITSSSLSFSWTAIPGAVGYEITIDGGASFQSPSSGVNGTTHTISNLNPGQSITLQVRALGAQSCENSPLSDAVTAFVPDKNLFVPNVFTPNGDGKNDILKVFSNSIASMEFRIFNQWGQEIFASANPLVGWDGTYKGSAQPVGVYVYVLKVVLTDGTTISRKGSVSLIR